METTIGVYNFLPYFFKLCINTIYEHSKCYDKSIIMLIASILKENSVAIYFIKGIKPKKCLKRNTKMLPKAGIEPAPSRPQREVLPLNYLGRNKIFTSSLNTFAIINKYLYLVMAVFQLNFMK